MTLLTYGNEPGNGAGLTAQRTPVYKRGLLPRDSPVEHGTSGAPALLQHLWMETEVQEVFGVTLLTKEDQKP